MNAKRILSFSSFNNVLLIAAALMLLVLPVRAQEVVIAFDDVLGPSATLDGMARTQMIISGLRRAEVDQALFLVSTRKITPKTNSKARLQAYDNAGHIIASRGHDHNLFKKVNLYAYEIDLLKAHARLQEFNHYHGYFHFGYHAAGGDLAVRRRLNDFARENALQPIYVNVKSQDAYLNQQYIAQVNANRRVDMAALETLYVDMVWQGLLDYHRYTFATVGPSSRIVLLLQENDLAAYFIAPLVERIRAHGWQVASPSVAFSYPKTGRAPISLHTPDGYAAALAGVDLMARDIPFVSPAKPEDVDRLPGMAHIFP